MKSRHFFTIFRASLFFLVSLCSSLAFSDGTCELIQNPDGTFRIVCEGGRIDYITEYKTNHVYIIENCEALKRQLLSTVNTINNDLLSTDSYLVDILNSSEQIYYSTSADQYGLYIRGQVANITNQVALMRFDLAQVSYGLVGGGGTPSYTPLRYQIESIECGSCSTNNSGSCCDVDLTPILRAMNEAQIVRFSTTNLLSRISKVLGDPDSFDIDSVIDYHYLDETLGSSMSSTYIGIQNDIVSSLLAMSYTLAETQASINNYLYKISELTLPSISNNVEHLYIESTNHFSFFRSMVFQDSPLSDFSQQSNFDSYYDFLTNHYLKVSFKQYNELLGDEKSKTNWFSRIETLLAALVFYDSESTNTVDDTYGKSQQNNLINSLDGMETSSKTQVNLMSDMGDNLLASLRSLNSSFSAAVSMPAEVTLASISSNSDRAVNYLKFQSSEISQLVEACRCATTLAWCIGGIWLLFLFVSWSIKTSYSLCVFCWSVVSAIFGGGKT